MNGLAKFLATAVLLLFGIAGLGMALCGAAFSVVSLFQLGQPHAFGLWPISLPSLAVGVLVLWGALKLGKKLRDRHRPPSDVPAPADLPR
jgi:hypothetical protein